MPLATLPSSGSSTSASLSEIYSDHGAALVGFIRKQVGSRELAEDILHDLFLNIWSRIDTWDVRGDLQTYLFSAARNHVWSHYAKLKVRREHAEHEKRTAPSSAPADAVERIQGEALQHAVAGWIAELPARRREVFELSRYEHLTYQEIAERLEISVKTVETQMSRALRHLRERLHAFEAS